MRRLIPLLLPAALWAQCTVTTPTTCPASGSPAAHDLFGDTVTWTGVPSVFGGPNMGSGAGQDFRPFTSGQGVAFASIIKSFSPSPSNTIQYAAEFWPLWQDFFLSDPSSCPSPGPPTCLYNNVAYAEAAADALFKPLGDGGMGLQYTDINIDPAPWFMASQYSTYCQPYST